MAPREIPVLTVEADIDDDGTLETGEFHFGGNVDVTSGTRTGYIAGGVGGQLNAFFGSALGDGPSRQEGIHLGAGGGTRQWQLSFRGWKGSNLRWGDTGNGGSIGDATGEHPLTQISVFQEYLARGDVDGRNPATFEYGEYHPDGRFDPVDVVVEEPGLTKSFEDGSSFDGDMTLLATANLNEVLDALERVDF